jgi:hypothetical protein
VKKSEKSKFYGQNKLFSENPALRSFSHMQEVLRKYWKTSLIPVFNKNSPRAHVESKLDVLGVHGKLVKYVVYLSKRKN